MILTGDFVVGFSSLGFLHSLVATDLDLYGPHKRGRCTRRGLTV